MAVFGLLVAGVIAYISVDLLTDGLLSRLLGGALAAVASPAPEPAGPDISRPQLVPEAGNVA